MLHVILLESAIELVPASLTSTKQIQRHAGRRGKKPNQVLLDQTHHGQAMTRLENSHHRGRPDITYLCLMTLLETPLCKQGLLTIHIHLQDGRVIDVNPSVRLPRNYDRFVGLIEQLLLNGKVPPQGDTLLKITNDSLEAIVAGFSNTHSQTISVLCVEGGEKTTIGRFHEKLPTDPATPVILGVGAFPHGEFSDEVRSLFRTHVELDQDVMMAWHVCAEALWTYSHKVGIVEARYRS